MREVRPLADVGVDPLDDKVRARLVEIRAAAGVPDAQLSLEVLYFLPKDFLNKYEELFIKAVKTDGGESARNLAQQQSADVGKASGTKGGAKPAKKRYKKSFVVLDEKALAVKTRVDKRLRGIAREITEELEWGLIKGGGRVAKIPTQCKGCGMFLSDGWQYCPKDGMNRDDE